ncbi:MULTISPECIES: endonuclease SmrB [Shewanella]|uniref:endonuclease SmrB n=1 Tax=Shewanella TaxID=22 RepID=UPI001C65E937|nr:MULTISPECIES: endonuclease SmrB [Shewanella]QYJ92474.1 endonuclease SmrB [Shewanella spartinae]QYJ96357.1 endonuclease SmrB [Shewanella alkalitolerans]
MNKENDDELALFSALTKGIKPLKQDKRHFAAPQKPKRELEIATTQLHADSYFSDTYQPLLPLEGAMRWSREDVDSHELKRLRRGDYQPDLLLDLHGMRQTEAKLELAALIQACVKQHSHCCCVMHGHGTGILKQNLPMWLAQHPQVKAFHKAPKEWGGDAALLVLIDVGELPSWD